MFRSLRVRMAASHAAVLAVILVALGVTGLFLLERSLDRSATSQLLAAAREEADRIAESGRLAAPPDSDLPSAAATRVAVFDAAGNLVDERDEAPAWLRPSATGAIANVTVAGEPVRIVTVRAVSKGHVIATVVAGRSLVAERRLIDRVRLLLLAGGGVAIVVSLFAGWLLAGRAVRPVERAYEAQAGFAADASHELRSPLAFVRSGVEVLAERDQELGAQVLGEIDYLTSLTHRLLTLARAERDRMDLAHEAFDLVDAARAAVRRSSVGDGTVLRIEGDTAPALGDRMATEAALDAVLENVAVHGAGAATVRVGTANAHATIAVEDHGPGLPDELGDRAFERFARADPSRARATGGAGLGLSLAQALIGSQGGTVELRPTRGGGLTVVMSLPAVPPVPPPPVSTQTATPPAPALP